MVLYYFKIATISLSEKKISWSNEIKAIKQKVEKKCFVRLCIIM